MRVDPSGTYSSITPGPVGVTQSGAIRSAESVESAGPRSEESAFIPTGDLANLLRAVQDLPDVRAGVVQEVAGRVASGEVASPQAAAETAEAFLDAQENPGE